MAKLFARRGGKSVPPVKQVKLKLVQIDFWSAIRMGFFLTLAAGIATIVGFMLIWVIVSFTGLGSSLNSLLATVGLTDATSSLSEVAVLGRVVGFAVGLAVFNMVVGTILAGIWAIIYNVIARISGGLSVGFTNN
jgi:hypothetical protein